MSLILGNLATTIVAEVPVLLERTLKQGTDNRILQERYSELKLNIETIKQRINTERAKQHHLRAQLIRLRGPPPSKSASIRELRGNLQLRDIGNSVDTRSMDFTTELGSFASDGSPVSLRSKRKGMVFSDDFKISKKMRLDLIP